MALRFATEFLGGMVRFFHQNKNALKDGEKASNEPRPRSEFHTIRESIDYFRNELRPDQDPRNTSRLEVVGEVESMIVILESTCLTLKNDCNEIVEFAKKDMKGRDDTPTPWPYRDITKLADCIKSVQDSREEMIKVLNDAFSALFLRLKSSGSAIHDETYFSGISEKARAAINSYRDAVSDLENHVRVRTSLDPSIAMRIGANFDQGLDPVPDFIKTQFQKILQIN